MLTLIDFDVGVWYTDPLVNVRSRSRREQMQPVPNIVGKLTFGTCMFQPYVPADKTVVIGVWEQINREITHHREVNQVLFTRESWIQWLKDDWEE